MRPFSTVEKKLMVASQKTEDTLRNAKDTLWPGNTFVKWPLKEIRICHP